MKKTPREELIQQIIDHPEICDEVLTYLQTIRSAKAEEQAEPGLAALEIYPMLSDENKRKAEARLMEIAAAEGVL